MSRPPSSPASRVVAVAAGLLAVACAAVVTGSAVGTLTAPDRVTTPVDGPRAGAAPSSSPADAPAGDGVLADPAGDAVVAASTRTRVGLGSAGSVVLVVDGGRLQVESVAPAQGWQVDRVDDAGGDRVEVRLRGAGDARLEARVVGGKVVVDRVRAPGA